MEGAQTGEGGTLGDMNRLQSAKEKRTAGGEICSGRCVFVWRGGCVRTLVHVQLYSTACLFCLVYNKHAVGP